MDLQLTGKTIAVGGATSGLGRAICEALLAEGAHVIGIARTQRKLDEMGAAAGAMFEGYAADLTDATAINRLADHLNNLDLYGSVFNAGGPPTGRTDELELKDWDDAYHGTLRWKIQLTAALLPKMMTRGNGRLLYVESVSIKQPIDNMVLSNVMRAGMAGYVKTLSREVGASGVTCNILAPGYHATPRITTVLHKSAASQELSIEEIETQFTAETATKKIGDPKDFAAMALFLLSPAANYLTGQTISVDGGLVRHITG